MTNADDRGSFIWYELMTPDAAAAKAFYDAVVGWDIDRTNSVPDGNMDYRMVKRSDGGFAGGLLAMTPEMISDGGKPGWYGYVHVPDVDAAVKQIEDAGGQTWMGPQDMEGVGRMALVSDPQGAPLYVMTPTPPAGNPDARSDVFSVDRAQHVRWNELWTSDAEAALALFGRLFGWRQDGAMDMGPMGSYRFLYSGDLRIGAVGDAQPDGDGPRWVYYIGVDTIDRAARAVAEGGGKVLQGPHQIPGGEFTAICADPQGIGFGIVGAR